MPAPAPPKGACGKRIYPDRISALLVIAETRRKDSPRRTKLECREYWCHSCSGYHTTSRPGRKVPEQSTTVPDPDDTRDLSPFVRRTNDERPST